jgi:predicted NodU family carbamoyl transferase
MHDEMMSTSDRPVYVLGISGKHNQGMMWGDAHHPSAALLKDGEIVAMESEERFVRIKYAIGHFPYYSIKFCLDQAGINLEDQRMPRS